MFFVWMPQGCFRKILGAEIAAMIRQVDITGLLWRLYERRINIDSRVTLVPTHPGVSECGREATVRCFINGQFTNFVKKKVGLILYDAVKK